MQKVYECDLSVIVPVYNLENYIKPMLDCLKTQQLGGYKVEYIFVLNNCTDRSEAVIRESGLKCTVMNCTEQGCGCARNAGFEVCKGEYVWFLDGDDWLLSNTAIQEALTFAKGKDIVRIPFTSNRFNRDYFSMVWQYIFRKEFIEEFRFRKIQPSEDDDYMRKVFAKLGITVEQYKQTPTYSKPLYFYNYLREGSNMWRYLRGENINVTASVEADPYRLQILTPHWKEEPSEMLPLLDSIALQQAVDFRDIGVIIVFDGEEATPLPEVEWKNKYPYDIQFLHVPHGGVSAARNAALDASTATYVMFCDADDMFFHMCGLNLIIRETLMGEFDTMTTMFIEETHEASTGLTMFIQHPQDVTFIHGKVHRRKYLIDNDIRFDPKLKIHEDSYFNVLARTLTNRVKYHPTGIYLWRWRDKSICREDPFYLQKTWPKLIDSSDALVDELSKRGAIERAQFHCGCMIFDTYYALNTPKWKLPENKKYRYAAEKRLKEYLKKHKSKWDAASEAEKVAWSQTLRERYLKEGMTMESISFTQWLKHIEEIR